MKPSKLLAIAAVIVAGAATTINANDAVYYARGSQLVPMQETDISVSKEVLTFTLGDDGYALVDVQYVFNNAGPAKTVKMGFEATSPYNTGDEPNPAGVHPYIDRFTVEFNGEKLSYTNSLVMPPQPDVPEEFLQYTYVYAFDAPFRSGENRVHHTYRYRMSYGVSNAFMVPYWLTPAMRWANKRIDDFTLRISVPKTEKYFCLVDTLFAGAEFKVIEGTGKVRHNQFEWSPTVFEIALRDGTVEWHKTNFVPSDDFTINSVDCYIGFDESVPVGAFYDRGDYFVIHPYDRKIRKDIARNLPYASRGYVFKRKDLQKYFEQFFWYMPDKNYVPGSDELTPREQRLQREGR